MQTIGELQFSGHFEKAPDPSLIQSPAGLPEGALRYLQYLENRAEDARGDTKWYDKHAAAVLGVSSRTVERWKQKLIKRKLIGTCRQRIRTDYGKLRTIQVFRCWRVVIKHHFNIRKKVAWSIDIRPPITSKLTEDVDPSWVVTGPVIMNNQNGRRIVRPRFKNLIELVQMGLWNPYNSDSRREFIGAQLDFHATALKVMGYPLAFKAKQLGWSKEEIEEYYNS